MTAKTAAKGGFTPGEWTVTVVPVSEHEYRLYDGDGNIHKSIMAERQANAKLMQFAPKLYKALRQLLEIVEQDHSGCSSPDCPIEQIEEARELLEAIHG